MRLIKLIVPGALIAVVALFAPHADAQTMGEYATTAGVGSGGGSSMGTSIGGAVSNVDLGGSSSTWGASSTGASFDERAGAASSSGASDFEARAGSMASGSTGESRWPAASQLSSGDTSSRFGDSSGADSGRFSATDRFNQTSALSSSSDRFPASSFNDNANGLDTSANAINTF